MGEACRRDLGAAVTLLLATEREDSRTYSARSAPTGLADWHAERDAHHQLDQPGRDVVREASLDQTCDQRCRTQYREHPRKQKWLCAKP
jgi:hypothetical protein